MLIREKSYIRKELVLGLIMLCSINAIAQPMINGPSCILPGLNYQYIIEGAWTSTSNLKICITGGRLSNGDTCTAQGTIPYMILVTWGNSLIRKIEVSSSLGNTSMDVKATVELKGGQINASDLLQIYSVDQSVYTFRCKDAVGGTCAPNYFYQWQISKNAITWTDIDGKTDKDLKFKGRVEENTFFRRVTRETNSNSISYSDFATLIMQF